MTDTRAPAAPLAARLQRPALWLALLLLAATILARLVGSPGRHELVGLTLACNLLFVGVASALIAVISIRSFTRTGAWPVLWLGAGSLAFGLAVAFSSVFLAAVGTNAGVTAHNLISLIAGALHTAGAFFTINRIPGPDPGRGRRAVLRQVFGSSLALIALIAAGAGFGFLPSFFVDGQGGTPLRQMVVASAAALFIISGAVFLRHYAQRRTPMIYWYALGLLLAGLGLLGILSISATGTPLNWIGRVSQWTGGLYLLVAALVTWGEARARQMGAEEVLAGYFLRRESNLRHVFDNVPDAVIVTDRDFRITFWNHGAEQLYGWPAAEAVGRPSAELIRPEGDLSAERGRLRDRLLAGEPAQSEARHLRRDGRPVTVLSSVSPLKDDRGAVIGMVAINRDITERRLVDEEIRRLNAGLAQRAAQLEGSNRELEAFAYSVSHDLRAPLRGIRGYAQALEEDCGDRLDATGLDYLRQLRLNAQRMSDLIDDLLALSRVGRQEPERVPVDLAEIARVAWAELAAEAAGRHVELRVAAMPPASADPTLVKQVYANLLSNALKFTRAQEQALIEVGWLGGAGRPSTETAAEGAPPVYFVADNGIGFEMEHADRVFGLFQRLHLPTEYEGTGVGLPIVRRVVERHGGRVWAESAPGRGATFYFTLGDGASGRD